MRARPRAVYVGAQLVGGQPLIKNAPYDPTDTSDAGLMNNAQIVGQQLLASTTLGASISGAWATAEAMAAKTAAGASSAITTGLVVSTYVISDALPALGFQGLADVLADLMAEVLDAILEAITISSISDILTGLGAGASFGYVGAVIGAIIGAIVAGVEALVGGPTVQITNGTTVSCQTYAQTNLPSAVTFLSSQKTLMGFTPKWLADTFGLFLANPVWMTINQGLLGLNYPNVPAAGTGSPVDQIYQLPGAFELLAKAQFAEAATHLATTASKLPFFRSIPGALALQQAGIPLAAAEVEIAAFAFPSQNPNDWSSVQFPQPFNGQPCTVNCDYSEFSWAPEGAVVSSDGTIEMPQVVGTSAVYTPCLNLLTNSNVVAGGPTNGHPGAATQAKSQTAQNPAACALQVLFPALTTDQCAALFAATQPAYQTAIDNAQNWANSQATLTLDQLTSGSQWNLTLDDANAVLQNWSSAALALVADAAAGASKGLLSSLNSFAATKARAASMAAAQTLTSDASAAASKGLLSSANSFAATGARATAAAQSSAAAAAAKAASPAGRVQILASYVSRFVSPAAGNAVLTGVKLP